MAQATLAELRQKRIASTTLRMAFGRVLSIAVLLGSSVVALGDEVCSADGECDGEENSLLALRAQQDSETRRRLPPTQCINAQGTHFSCAGGDSCCIGACVGMGDVCCVNVNGDGFPCQGKGGGCCGNACYAPGSKCCRSLIHPKSQWYPVTKATQCRSGFVGFPGERPLLWSCWDVLLLFAVNSSSHLID